MIESNLKLLLLCIDRIAAFRINHIEVYLRLNGSAFVRCHGSNWIGTDGRQSALKRARDCPNIEDNNFHHSRSGLVVFSIYLFTSTEFFNSHFFHVVSRIIIIDQPCRAHFPLDSLVDVQLCESSQYYFSGH